MIYVFHGTDTETARRKRRELVDALLKKKPDALNVPLDAEDATFDCLLELARGQGLFEQKYIVTIDRAFESKNKDVVLESLPELGASDNLFLLLESKLLKQQLTTCTKHATAVYVFDAAKSTANAAPRSNEFSLFSVSDALALRDKKNLWICYQQALAAGKTPEELHGILLWQVRTLLAALRASDAKAAGLNPFVYKKAQTGLKHYTRSELVAASATLVSLYHDVRRGRAELDIELELFVLGL